MKKVLFFISCVVLQFGSVSAIFNENTYKNCLSKNQTVLDAYNKALAEYKKANALFNANPAVINYRKALSSKNLDKQLKPYQEIRDNAYEKADAAYNTALRNLQAIRESAYNTALNAYNKSQTTVLEKSQTEFQKKYRPTIIAYNTALQKFKNPLTPDIRNNYLDLVDSCVQEQNPTPYIPKMGFYNAGKHKNI